MRARVAALAAIVAVLLTGCVSIPNSGAVQSGDVVDTDTDLQPVYQPSGPQTGATQDEIITDFIQAALDPQNDYKTARLFLAGGVRQTWNPNAGVTVRLGVGTLDAPSDSQRRYIMTASAKIDANGIYTEEPKPESVPIDFTLVKEKGEWRIASLPDGIVIGDSTFDRVFAAHPLYFFDPSYRYLVPDVRWFATTDQVTTRIANSLLAGPASWLANGVLVTAVPPGTTLDAIGVVVDSGLATVPLSAEARTNTSSRDRNRMQQQLAQSLTSVGNVRAVALTVGGVDLTTPGTFADPTSAQPTVNTSYLVRQGDAFGFTSGEGLTPIPSVSSQVLAVAALGASYAAATSTAAVRTEEGVYLVRAAEAAPVLVDPRADLVDPSIDNSGFVWSVQRASVLSLQVIGIDGVRLPMSVETLGEDGRVIAMHVSRDGARLLLYLDGDSGPRLIVAGIVRDQNGVPMALGGDPVQLPVTDGTPIDATWESDRAVAALAGDSSAATITEYAIGGRSTVLGSVANAVQLVGGNGGAAGLRLRDGTGAVLRATGTGTVWRSAGIEAVFIATQQPG